MRMLSPLVLLALSACAQTLPVNWQVQPAGTQIALDSLPLSAAVSPDGKFLLALNAGSQPSISVVETGAMKETARVAIADAGLGLAFSPDGRRVYAGGGSRNAVLEFTFSSAGELKVSREISAGPPAAMNFIGDVAVSPDGRTILAGDLFHDRVLAINAQSGQVAGAFKSGRRPYRILVHPDGKSFFVSSWADASVYEYSLPSGNEMARVRVGAHPTDLVLSNRKIPGEQSTWQYRLFVAAANTNDVFVVGVSEGKELDVLETLNAGFSAVAPAGMTPSGLALSADQTRLYIACSDVNALAVADVSATRSRLAGFVPVGAYPTAVHVCDRRETRGVERPQWQHIGDRCSDGRNAAGVDEQGDGADALSRVVFGFPARAAIVDRACDLHPDGRSMSGTECGQARARVRAPGEFPSCWRYARGGSQLGRSRPSRRTLQRDWVRASRRDACATTVSKAASRPICLPRAICGATRCRRA